MGRVTGSKLSVWGVARALVGALLLAAFWTASASIASAAAPGFTHVQRFYNTKSGAHLYTTDINEYWALLKNRSYRDEGLAYSMWTPLVDRYLHRFYNVKKGVHFYSANPDEIASIRATLSDTYRYEGIAYPVGSNGIAIHRFYNVKTGVHFYSADPVEVASVKTNLTALYRYEGIAFYAPQYISTPTYR